MNPGDLTTLANAKAWLGLGGIAIRSITQDAVAPVITIQQPSTPLFTGATVGIYGVNGPTDLNGNEYVITVITPTSFSIPADTFSLPAYTSGGYVAIGDTLMQRLISSVSTYIQSWLNRTIRNLDYSQVMSGQGGKSIMLPDYPITAVNTVFIDGITIPQRPNLGVGATVGFIGVGFGAPWYMGGPPGFTWDNNRVMLTGAYEFTRGFSNVQIDYSAGFMVSNEPQTIPSVSPYVLTTQAHWNAGDRGVVYSANNAPLTQVTSGPVAGQYSIDSNGVYTFSAADAGVSVQISYSYVPFDVEQAAVDMIGDWFKYRSRIGVLSESIEQQTITFTNQSITARAQGILNQYRRVFPVAA